MPGAYQGLKYKVLKCAEAGLDVKSPNVEAILVAWRKPDDMKFLRDYDIRFRKKGPSVLSVLASTIAERKVSRDT